MHIVKIQYHQLFFSKYKSVTRVLHFIKIFYLLLSTDICISYCPLRSKKFMQQIINKN
jgi:hypothetical protein